jgi:hypothetical protein
LKRPLILLLALLLASPGFSAADSSAACGSSSCKNSDGSGASCNTDNWVQGCADSCTKSFGTTVGTGAVYIAAGAVAVIVIAACTVWIIKASKGEGGKKRKKKRGEDEEEGAFLKNTDLLPGRASLQAAPVL